MKSAECAELKRVEVDGVALVEGCDATGTGVTFCFTERSGGVSAAPYASLNLSTKTGDTQANVDENRRRAMAAMGAEDLLAGIVVPKQVHGDEVAVISDASAPLPPCICDGADAVVCTVPDQAVMLLFADCTPVVLTCPGGFAVVHSGWKGTLAGISGKAAGILSREAGCPVSDVRAYIGPHIGAESYEVSAELVQTFEDRFGRRARFGERNLDLGACVTASLCEAGVPESQVFDGDLCTARSTDRFFSHRMEAGMTGRHAAIAFMRS